MLLYYSMVLQTRFSIPASLLLWIVPVAVEDRYPRPGNRVIAISNQLLPFSVAVLMY